MVERLGNPRLRGKEGLFLVEGVRSAREALRPSLPFRVRFALVSPRLMETEGGASLRLQMDPASFPVEEIGDSDLREVSDTMSPQGVLLVVEEPSGGRLALPSGSGGRILLLDGLRDPGNAGTLVRGAWAFGLSSVVFLDGTVDPWSPKVVRAAAGACFHVPVSRASWKEVEEELRTADIPVLAADGAGEDVRETRVPPAWALAIGNEVEGVRAGVRQVSAASLAVPMAAGVDSLNAGVAGSILLYSLTSQDARERDD
ncbi:TrmH family RNA methyltransferase [Gemmatimonadota bacterium]